MLLAAASRYMPKKCVRAALCLGPMTPPWEAERGRALARELGVALTALDLDELSQPRIAANGPERCYYCKRHKMEHLVSLARELKIEIVADGSQLDDQLQHRPGQRALAELGIVSPLNLAGFDKAKVRALSAMWGLPPSAASACLATRIAANTPLTEIALKRIAAAEAMLRPLFTGALRLRDYFPHARLEVEPHQLDLAARLQEDCLPQLRQLGYQTLEVAPYFNSATV